MNRFVSALLIVAAFGVTYAEEAASPKTARPKVTKQYKATGGRILVPDSRQGRVVVFNAQKVVPFSDVKSPLVDFQKSYGYTIDFVDGVTVSPKTADVTMRKANAQIAVFLVAGDECPVPTLVAPDSRWAMVNVSAVAKGAKTPAFVSARMRKALMRAFLCAAGAFNSQFDGSEMRPIRDVADYDVIIEDPPLDVIARVESSLRYWGVTPAQYKTYRRACQEGWAPAPTNEIQKAIWEKVHKAPTAPIVIKPEPKKSK